jgi:type II secretory pathway component PulM
VTLRDRLPTLRPRDRRAVRAGAWILVPLLIGTVVIRPYITALEASRSALENEADLLARETRAVLDLPSDSATLRATSLLLVAAAPRLFGGSDAVTAAAELARYVSASATACGLHLEQAETQTRADSVGQTSLASAPARATEGDSNLRVTIRARGGVLAIYAFLRAMEDGEKLVRVERIDIVRTATDDTFDGTLTVTATVAGLARRGVVGSAAAAASEDQP